MHTRKEKSTSNKDILESILSGDKRAVAKLISIVENEPEKCESLLDSILPYSFNAHRIGVTGPPGSGKSTLVDALTSAIRKSKPLSKIGIIAIDPSSPFTGGALLGDRIRMRRIGLDENVFVRSMATRGALGGLCAAATDVADILAASGKDYIITETVGVGQSEIEIAQISDTCIVVLSPATGDSIQTLKAGLMEIGDIFVINKADYEGADHFQIEVSSTLQLRAKKEPEWNTPVIQTVATDEKGIAELFEQIEKHKEFLSKGERLNKKRIAVVSKRISRLVRNMLEKSLYNSNGGRELQELSKSVLEGETTLYKAARKIVERLKNRE